MLLLVLFWQLPGHPVLNMFSNCYTGSRYRNTFDTKLSPPRISSSSLLLHATCVISSQSNLFNDLVTLLQPSVDSSIKITDRSFQHATPHLWNKLPSTLHVPYHSSASLLPAHHHYPLFSIVMLWSYSQVFLDSHIMKTFQSLYLHGHLALAQAHLLECGHSVFDSHWRW